MKHWKTMVVSLRRRAMPLLAALIAPAAPLRSGEMQSLSLPPGGAGSPEGSLLALRVGRPVLWVAPAKAKKAPPPPLRSPEFGSVYAFPNPARGTPPAVHVEAPGAEGVILSFYDASGAFLHRAELSGPPSAAGGAPAFEYVWRDAKAGVILCRVVAFTSGRGAVHKTIKLAVLP